MMLASFWAVYWRELLILRRRFKRQLAGVIVSPFLYLVTFGLALGARMEVDGQPYINFLLPGLVAMSSMTQAFGIASEINIARFYSGVFEDIQASPASRVSYVLGEVCAGITRVFIATVVILSLGLLFGVRVHNGVYFWLAVLLNGFVFSSLAVCLAMLVRSHADQGYLNTFVITPMAFLGGTFFPVDALPRWARSLLAILPLTHASQAIRRDAFGLAPEPWRFFVLAGVGVACFLLAMHTVGKARD